MLIQTLENVFNFQGKKNNRSQCLKPVIKLKCLRVKLYVCVVPNERSRYLYRYNIKISTKISRILIYNNPLRFVKKF